MSNVKNRLLEVIGETDLDDLGEEVLIAVLADKIKRQKDEINRLHRENAEERERLYDERQSIKQELIKMKNDPLYCAQGVYFFQGERFFQLVVKGPELLLYEKKGNNYITYMRVPREAVE